MTGQPPVETWLTRVRTPARAAYVAVLLLATLTPFAVDSDGARVAERLARVAHPSFSNRDVVDGARNIILFAGWGVVWALTAVGPVRRIITAATLSGAAISAAVESAQLFSSNRTASLLDLSTNTGGAIAGALVLVTLVGLASARRRARSFVGIPTTFFAVSYAAAAWLEAFIPLFRQGILPTAFGGPFSRLSAALAAFRWESLFEFTVSDLPIFLPAGALAVAALAEHGMPYPVAFRRTAAWGAILVVLAEIMHGGLGQPLIAGAVLLHAGAVAGGAWAAAKWLPALSVALRGSARSRALTIAYMAILAAWAWRPFLPEVTLAGYQEKFDTPWYIPLAALGMRVDFFSVVDVCAPFFLYLPLGALLAAWPWRREGALAGPLPGVLLALALEVGQVVVLYRMLDVTDAIVTASGVLVGWAVMRRAGYRPYGVTFPPSARRPATGP